MLIGAHVSPAGGPANAVARGVEQGCQAIQIFNQNPRAWRPTTYDAEQVSAFHQAMAASDVDALLIHAVYLLNAASEDPDFREKTLTSLIASLRAGDALNASPSSCIPARRRPGRSRPRSLVPGRSSARLWPRAITARCTSRTPQAPAPRSAVRSTSSRSSSTRPAAEAPWPVLGLVPSLGLGIRHPHRAGLTEVLDQCVGSSEPSDSGRCTSTTRRRRWAPTAIATRMSAKASWVGGLRRLPLEPRFEGLAVVLETPGVNRSGPTAEEIALTKRLRAQGLRRRRRG